MLTGAQVLDTAMLRLVRSDSSLRAALLVELNLAIRTRFEQGEFIPWFMYAEDDSLVTVANQEWVLLSNDFLRFPDDQDKGGVFVLDTTITTPDQYVPLTRMPRNKMLTKYAAEETATPEVYTVEEHLLYLRSIPDAEYSLRVAAMWHDADVGDDGSYTKWTRYAGDLMVAEATRIGAQMYTRDKALEVISENDVKLAWARLQVAHIAHMESGQSRLMGGDD